MILEFVHCIIIHSYPFSAAVTNSITLPMYLPPLLSASRKPRHIQLTNSHFIHTVRSMSLSVSSPALSNLFPDHVKSPPEEPVFLLGLSSLPLQQINSTVDNFDFLMECFTG